MFFINWTSLVLCKLYLKTFPTGRQMFETWSWKTWFFDNIFFFLEFWHQWFSINLTSKWSFCQHRPFQAVFTILMWGFLSSTNFSNQNFSEKTKRTSSVSCINLMACQFDVKKTKWQLDLVGNRQAPRQKGWNWWKKRKKYQVTCTDPSFNTQTKYSEPVQPHFIKCLWFQRPLAKSCPELE